MSRALRERFHNGYVRALGVVLAGIFLCDLLGKWIPRLGFLGYLLWVASFFLLLVPVTESLLSVVRAARERKAIGTAVLLFSWIVVFLWAATFPSSVSQEAPFEVSCALGKILGSPSAGFHELCFLGYPTRTYYFASLPSLFFGPSPLALNMGFGLFVIFGLVVFVASGVAWLHDSPGGDGTLAVCLAALSNMYVLTHLLFSYEQVVLPVALGFLLCGFFARFAKARKTEDLLWIGISLLYCVGSYTPSLALYPAAFGILGLWFVRRGPLSRHQRALVGFILLASFTSFLLLASYRLDLWRTPTGPLVAAAGDRVEGLVNFFLRPEGASPFFSPLLHYVFLATMLAGLLFFWGLRFWLMSAWILVFIVLALLSRGYAEPPVAASSYRAVVVLPVFLVLFTRALVGLLERSWFRSRIAAVGLLAALVVLFLTLGVRHQHTFFEKRSPREIVQVVLWLEERLAKKEIPASSQLWAGSARSLRELINTSQYFLPRLAVEPLGDKCEEMGKALMKEAAFLVDPRDGCLPGIRESGARLIAEMASRGGPIQLYFRPATVPSP